MQAIGGKLGEDRAHSLSEFPNFPWHLVEPDKCGVSYGGITANVDFNPMRPHICFVGDDGFADDWEIPQELADMLKQHRQWGRRDLANEFRSLLHEGDA